MTQEQANAIVAGVAACHKQFKPIKVYLYGTYAGVTFAPVTVDPRTVGKWFDDAGAYMFQVGTDVQAREMYLYFRERTDMP